MKLSSIRKYIILIGLCLFICPQILCGQSFIPVRIDGRSIMVKTTEGWRNYTMAKNVGELSSKDSIMIPDKTQIRLKDDKEKVFVISGKFKNTVQAGFDISRKKNRNKNGYFILSFNDKDLEFGQPTMAFRGNHINKDDIIQEVTYIIKEHGGSIKTKSISVQRRMFKKWYCYQVNNSSQDTLYVTVMEIDNGVFTKVDDDLVNMVILPKTTINLSDYALLKSRKKNSYYAIASAKPLLSIYDVFGEHIPILTQYETKRDYNLLIAGHR